MSVILVDNVGGENLTPYKPWPHAVDDPHVGSIPANNFVTQEDVWPHTGRENVLENNFTGPDGTMNFYPAAGDPNELPVSADDELELRRARRSKLIDTLFGIFGKASDVYTELKYGEDEKPYQLEISPGQEYRGLSTENYILMGAGILAVIVLVVSLKTK